MAIKKAKNTAILNDNERVVQKNVQVLEVSDSDYINSGFENIGELGKYNLKSINIIKGRNTIVEIYKEV